MNDLISELVTAETIQREIEDTYRQAAQLSKEYREAADRVEKARRFMVLKGAFRETGTFT